MSWKDVWHFTLIKDIMNYYMCIVNSLLHYQFNCNYRYSQLICNASIIDEAVQETDKNIKKIDDGMEF